MKCRSKEPGHSVSLKDILRTITIQGLTLATVIAAEKQILMLNVKITAKSSEHEM